MRRPKLLPWRHIVYYYAVFIPLGFAFYFMLGHRDDWWGWMILVVYVAVILIIPFRWQRKTAPKT